MHDEEWGIVLSDIGDRVCGRGLLLVLQHGSAEELRIGRFGGGVAFVAGTGGEGGEIGRAEPIRRPPARGCSGRGGRRRRRPSRRHWCRGVPRGGRRRSCPTRPKRWGSRPYSAAWARSQRIAALQSSICAGKNRVAAQPITNAGHSITMIQKTAAQGPGTNPCCQPASLRHAPR